MTAVAMPSASPQPDPRGRRKHRRKGTLWHGTLRTTQGSVASPTPNFRNSLRTWSQGRGPVLPRATGALLPPCR